MDETLVFVFEQDGRPRSARDVAYRVHAAPGPLGAVPGEVLIDLYDHAGNPLSPPILWQGLGTRSLNDVFGGIEVAAFAV